MNTEKDKSLKDSDQANGGMRQNNCAVARQKCSSRIYWSKPISSGSEINCNALICAPSLWGSTSSLYQPTGEGLEVLRVRDGAQDVDDLFDT